MSGYGRFSNAAEPVGDRRADLRHGGIPVIVQSKRRSSRAATSPGGKHIGLALVGAAALMGLATSVVLADSDDQNQAQGLWQRDTLLDDIGGVRPWLGQYGVTFSLQEISEVLGNLTGGIHTGADYEGLT
ncbi:MAG: hypothetical protein KGL11_01835, partial [Alphaproteobacteria bacterium]|nr:hypothetical protein [Alphaproteobacteria bacterium]